MLAHLIILKHISNLIKNNNTENSTYTLRNVFFNSHHSADAIGNNCLSYPQTISKHIYNRCLYGTIFLFSKSLAYIKKRIAFIVVVISVYCLLKFDQ